MPRWRCGASTVARENHQGRGSKVEQAKLRGTRAIGCSIEQWTGTILVRSDDAGPVTFTGKPRPRSECMAIPRREKALGYAVKTDGTLFGYPPEKIFPPEPLGTGIQKTKFTARVDGTGRNHSHFARDGSPKLL